MKPIEEMSFEEALGELEKIVAGLESGDVPLAKSVEYYERGEKLRAHCEKALKSAELKIREISKTADGVNAKPNSDFDE